MGEFDPSEAAEAVIKVAEKLGANDFPDPVLDPEVRAEAGVARRFPRDTSPINVADLGATDRRSAQLHRFPKKLVTGWKQAVRPLLTAYGDAVAVATTDSAHIRAHEAAIKTLYDKHIEEVAIIQELPEHMTHEALALQLARMDSGLSAPPKADKRFKVEAFWVTITIRLQLIQVAQVCLDSPRGQASVKEFRSRWADFIEYIFDTVERDAQIAISTAEGSQSQRQVVRSVLLLLEARYQAFETRVGRYAGVPGQREKLIDQARDGLAEAKKVIAERSRSYRHAMNSLSEQTWVTDNFSQPGEAIVEKWVGIIQRLNRSVFYSEVTAEEKKSILKAFMSGFLGFCE